MDVEVIKSKLQAHDINFAHLRELPGTDGQVAVFFFCRTLTNVSFMIELKLKKGMNVSKVTVKCPNKAFSELCKQTVAHLIV